jgi:hypothetical protein
MENYVLKNTQELFSKVMKLQESVGEGGKSLNESPATKKSLLDRIKEDKMSTALMLLALGSVAITPLLIKDPAKVFNKNNPPKKYTDEMVGCFQINTDTGEINNLGLCHVGENIDDIAKRKYGTCCKTCLGDGDCTDLESKTTCKTTVDCLSSNKDVQCVGGKCQNEQKCLPTGFINPDNGSEIKTCSPCPAPDLQLSVQVPGMSFCNKYSSMPCAFMQLVCQPTSAGGTCENAKTGKGWQTMPMCGNVDNFVLSMMALNQNTEIWQPSSTPLYIKIMTIIGLVGFFITFLWYILYLVKNSKYNK